MEHNHSRCCGHDHTEHKHCCDTEHKCCCGHQNMEIPKLSDEENVFLTQLAKTPFLPIVSFVARSSKSSHLENIMLSPVYIEDEKDSLEIIKIRSVILDNLEEKGVISIDYDIMIENTNHDIYSIYKNSDAYNYFSETINESKNNPNFVFDIADLEYGSIALTGIGQMLLDD